MEMHGNDRSMGERKFTLYESPRRHEPFDVMARTRASKENIQISLKFVGSASGANCFHGRTALAAAAAMQLNRPVKLTLSQR